jgi:hypothetical protein
MRVLLETNDTVLVNYVEVLLRDAGIEAVVLDGNMSILEGSVGAIPRRILVTPVRWQQARALLSEADLGQWLKADDGR